MPTILDTLGVQMCTISYGKEASFAGKLANVTITVTPMAAGIGPIRLNWAATGDIFSPFSDTTSGDTGAPGIIALPRTDQDGFRHGSSPFKNWYYKAAVVAELADGQQLTRTYQFQTTSSTLDLDLLDEDSVVTALPVIVGAGTEPAGLSDATRAVLATTYSTQVAAAAQLATAVPGGNRVAFLGDSTVQHSGIASRAWNMSWTDVASMLSEGRIVDVGNAALSGYTTANVLSTQVPQVLALSGVSTALICVGTNDIATGLGGIASGITPAQTQANIAAIDTALAQAGIAPIWVTIPPRTAAAITAGAAGPVPNVHAKTAAFNAWLRDFANSRKRKLIDLWQHAVNPTTGEYKTGWSDDGIHPNYNGVVYEGEFVVNELLSVLPAWTPPLAGSFDDLIGARQLLTNPLFIADSNSDGIPDGWSVDSGNSTNYTPSLAPALRGAGNELTISNTGTNPGGARVLSDAITSGFTVGDRLGLALRLRCTSTFGPLAVIYSVGIIYNGATSNGTFYPISSWQHTLPDPGGLLYVEDVVPPGTTSIQVEIRQKVTSQGKLITSQATLRNLSAGLTTGWWAA